MINVRIYIFLFVFCALFVQTGNEAKAQSEQENIAKGYFFDGKILELQEDYTSAIEMYRNALNYDRSPGIYFAISAAYLKLDKPKEAITEINKAISLDPKEISYLKQKADIYYIYGDLNKASESYEQILSRDSDNTEVLFTLGRIYQELKMPAKALTLYEKITDGYGFDYEVLRRMYEIYFSYKNYEKCLETIKYILKLDPYDNNTQMKLAALYNITGKNEEAKNIYEKLYTLNPGSKEILTELIRLYFLSQICFESEN